MQLVLCECLLVVCRGKNHRESLEYHGGYITHGHGQNFIAALITKYWLNREHSVAIVTTTNFLVEQCRIMLGGMSQKITIVTIQQALIRQ